MKMQHFFPWLTLSVVLLSHVLLGTANATEREGRQNVLNVMLVALEAPKGDSAGEQVTFDDWRYWEVQAPGLVDYLTAEAGLVKAAKEATPADACAMAVNVADGEQGGFPPERIDECADTFTMATGRPSLVVLWLPKSGSTWALLHGMDALPLSKRIEAARRLDQATACLPSRTGLQLVMPPCLLSVSGAVSGERLEQSLGPDYRARIGHIVSALEYQIAYHQTKPESGFGATAPGTATAQLSSESSSKVVIDIPGINDTGASRPPKWAEVFMGKNEYERFNVRHAGSGKLPDEPGTTILLPKGWVPDAKGIQYLEPIFAAKRAGKYIYVKVDQNIGTFKYFGDMFDSEGRTWSVPVANFLASEIKKMDSGVEVYANLHSKGTVDGISLDWKHFDGAVVASPRNAQPDWQKVVDANRSTRFLFISGDRDLPHDAIGPGYLNMTGDNVTVANLKTSSANPLRVHGEVTDPTLRGVFDIKRGSALQKGVDGSISDITRVSLMPTKSALAPRPGLAEAVRVHKQHGAEDYDISKHGIGSNTPRDYNGTIFRIPSTNAPDSMTPKKPDPPYRSDLKKPDDYYPPPWGGPGRIGPIGGDPPPPDRGGSPSSFSRFQGPNSDLMRRMFPTLDKIPYGKVPMFSARPPGGVLFAPEIEIVIGKDGFTSEIERKVTDVLAEGEANSAPVTIDNKKMVAARVPGSRKLFEVKTGYFYFTPERGTGEMMVAYSSGVTLDVGLGRGWSVAPFCIQVREGEPRAELVDFMGGTRYHYTVPARTEGGPSEIVWGKVLSSLQPTVVQIPDGYRTEFADGRTIRFDAEGRMLMEQMGDRILRSYEYSEGKLTSVQLEGAVHPVTIHGASISVQDEGGTVACNIEGGRIVSLDIGKTKLLFEYGMQGWLAKAVTDGRPIFDNEYERGGQLVAQRTALGRTEYGYNHWLGKFTVHPEDGGNKVFFYDLNQRLIAYGSDPKQMTLLNYDARGCLFQVAVGEHINADEERGRPRFRVKELLISES